jgi:CBS domain containing-hemolysin-like protein
VVLALAYLLAALVLVMQVPAAQVLAPAALVLAPAALVLAMQVPAAQVLVHLVPALVVVTPPPAVLLVFALEVLVVVFVPPLEVAPLPAQLRVPERIMSALLVPPQMFALLLVSLVLLLETAPSFLKRPAAAQTETSRTPCYTIYLGGYSLGCSCNPMSYFLKKKIL